jgi:hypothetical protein
MSAITGLFILATLFVLAAYLKRRVTVAAVRYRRDVAFVRSIPGGVER